MQVCLFIDSSWFFFSLVYFPISGFLELCFNNCYKKNCCIKEIWNVSDNLTVFVLFSKAFSVFYRLQSNLIIKIFTLLRAISFFLIISSFFNVRVRSPVRARHFNLYIKLKVYSRWRHLSLANFVN